MLFPMNIDRQNWNTKPQLTSNDVRIAAGRREDLLRLAVSVLNRVHVIRLISCLQIQVARWISWLAFPKQTTTYSIDRVVAERWFPRACVSLCDESIPICTRKDATSENICFGVCSGRLTLLPRSAAVSIKTHQNRKQNRQTEEDPHKRPHVHC